MRNNPLSQTTTIIYRSAMSTCKRSFMDELGNCPYSFKKEESEGDRPLTSPKCAAVLPNLQYILHLTMGRSMWVWKDWGSTLHTFHYRKVIVHSGCTSPSSAMDPIYYFLRKQKTSKYHIEKCVYVQQKKKYRKDTKRGTLLLKQLAILLNMSRVQHSVDTTHQTENRVISYFSMRKCFQGREDDT